MRHMLSGMVAALAVATLGTAPAMACGGGLFDGPCGSPCAPVAVSPCGSSPYYVEYIPYQRLAVPSPQYYWVNQGPVYDGPGQFAPRPFYQERTVTGRRGHYYGYTGGPYADPYTHYSYGGPAWRGPAITSYRWRHRARPAALRYGYRPYATYRYAARPSMRYGHSHGTRFGHAPRGQYGVQRAMHPQANRTPRFRDSGSYSYRSGFRHGSRPHPHR